MNQLNLQRMQSASDSQQRSQLQFELQREIDPKQTVQYKLNLPFLSINEAMEKVREIRQHHQNIYNEPQPPQLQKTHSIHQNSNFQSEFMRHQQLETSRIMQMEQYHKQNIQPKIIIHPPSSHHQNSGSQQFHLVQVQVPGKETQLQLIPVQSKSTIPSTKTNLEQYHVTNIIRKSQTDVSNEFVSLNRKDYQRIYPSYYGASNSNPLTILKPAPCPPLTPLTPPPLTSQLVAVQEKPIPCPPSTSQLLPLQEIPLPNVTQFQEQLSNVVDVLPPRNISLEEIDIKPDINEPDPSEFLKSFLTETDVVKQKSKRKRKQKSWEVLLESGGSDVDDDVSKDYVEPKKRRKKSKSQSEESKTKNNRKIMESIRPCSVVLEKLMITKKDMPVKIVNNQIVKRRMPRTKTVSTNYNKITNIGFIEYPKGIAYKCLLQTCRFQSYDQEVFEKHLIKHHSQDASVEWTGYCCTCNDFITTQTLIDEFDHLLEYHLQTKKIVDSEIPNRKTEQSADQLDAEAILAIKEVLDTFEEIVAEVDSVEENVVDRASETSEEETDIEEKEWNEIIVDKVKHRKDKTEKAAKEPGTIAGRLIINRRKTVDAREPLPPRRSFRKSSHILEDEAKQQLPSVIVNSSNDGKIKMTIKNPTRINNFIIDKHKKKKDKKVTSNTFIQDPLTPPESSSNCTDSDYSEQSNIEM